MQTLESAYDIITILFPKTRLNNTIRMLYTILQMDNYFQRYSASNTPKIGFLKLWPGEKRLGRISSVTSYREHVLILYIKTIQKYCHMRSKKWPKIITFGGYLFVYELVHSRRLKTHHCILETEGNS